jgi:CelD/BcsL family acetyltransferase involved in cellulose biosynthesis
MSPLLDLRRDRAQGPQTMSTWSLLVSGPDSAATSLRQSWREMLAATEDPFMIYQSPEWFDLMRDDPAAPDSPHLATRRNANRELVGLVPLYPTEEPCQFPLTYGYAYKTRPKKMLHIASGRLLLPSGDRWFDGLFASLARRASEGRILKVSNVPVESPLHRYLETSPLLKRQYCLFAVPGLTRVHTIPLTPSYDEFLAKYSSKKRYNLRRQIRQLEQAARGGLELRRYDSEGSLPDFFHYWDQLLAGTGAPPPTPAALARREAYQRRLARNGLFCCYVLMDGTRPVAAIRGRRYDPVFMLDITRHDREYEAYSPGSCLLHMVIEQLIGGRSTNLINLGYGDPNAEYRATNLVLDHASYWLFPRTWKTRLFHMGYSNFRRGLSAVKAVLPNRTAPRGESEQ